MQISNPQGALGVGWQFVSAAYFTCRQGAAVILFSRPLASRLGTVMLKTSTAIYLNLCTFLDLATSHFASDTSISSWLHGYWQSDCSCDRWIFLHTKITWRNEHPLIDRVSEWWMTEWLGEWVMNFSVYRRVTHLEKATTLAGALPPICHIITERVILMRDLYMFLYMWGMYFTASCDYRTECGDEFHLGG